MHEGSKKKCYAFLITSCLNVFVAIFFSAKLRKSFHIVFYKLLVGDY